jgi:phospholipase C
VVLAVDELTDRHPGLCIPERAGAHARAGRVTGSDEQESSRGQRATSAKPRPSRRLGYGFDVAFDADSGTLNLAVKNRGRLGVQLQARSLTVPGAPYSYTIGAGGKLAASLPNPGTYDLSLHSPNGFFRHFAGSPDTVIRLDVHSDQGSGRLKLQLRLTDRGGHHRQPVVVDVADAYGRDRQIRLQGTTVIKIDTGRSGGWYDIALSTPSDPSFSYELAGRLESANQLTSDPQLSRR